MMLCYDVNKTNCNEAAQVLQISKKLMGNEDGEEVVLMHVQDASSLELQMSWKGRKVHEVLDAQEPHGIFLLQKHLTAPAIAVG